MWHRYQLWFHSARYPGRAAGRENLRGLRRARSEEARRQTDEGRGPVSGRPRGARRRRARSAL